jgi:hypothetical protein
MSKKEFDYENGENFNKTKYTLVIVISFLMCIFSFIIVGFFWGVLFLILFIYSFNKTLKS